MENTMISSSISISKNATGKVLKNNYYTRYKMLKMTIKQLVYENSSLEREIKFTEDKLVVAKVERKYLLRKLLQLEKPPKKETKPVQRKTFVNSESKNKTKRPGKTIETTAEANVEVQKDVAV